VRGLPDLALDRPVGTLMVLLSLSVLGGVAVFRLPLGFLPSIEGPEVRVEIPFPGSHPLEVVREAVRPIEEEIGAIAGLRSLYGSAGPEAAFVEARFDGQADAALKKLEVREAVERARRRLPPEVGFIRVEGGSGGPGAEGILHGRISAERDLSESWDLLDRKIRRPLERIRGVARVDLYGVERQQVRVELDLAALERHGVRPEELARAIASQNVELDLGPIRDGLLRFDARAVGRFRDIEEIRNLAVGTGGLRVRDLARVELREPRLDYGRHLNRRFAVGLDVYKEPAANTVDVSDRLMERIREIEKDPELRGIHLLVWANAGEEIRNSLRGVRNSGLFGGLLASAILYGFLRRVRKTLLVATAIPFSLLVTCGLLYAWGGELNVLTLLGLMLGVGMLVDNGIVVIENIHRLEQRGVPAPEAARRGAREVALAVTASTATTLIVWSWLLTAGRSELTIILGQVAATLCLAVACSLGISLSLIPLAAARFARERPAAPGFVAKHLVPGYRAVLAWTVRHRVLVLLGLVGVGSSAAIPIGLVEKQSEPRIQERAVAIRYAIADPSTKETLERYVDQVEQWLDSNRERLGFDTLYSWYSESQAAAVTQVYLPAGRARPADIARLRAAIESDLPKIAGVRLEIGDRMWWRRGGQGRRMVSVALHGDDPEFLEALASRVEKRLEGLEGAVRILGPTSSPQKEARILVDPERARALGTTPRAVADSVGFAFRGQRLATLRKASGEVEILVGLPEQARPGLGSLLDLPVARAGETTVRLGALARIETARTPNRIERQDRKTTTWLSVQFRDDVTTETGRARVEARLRGMELPAGYSWDWGEWGERREESLGLMLRGVLLSLLLVVVLMMALFESFSQPFAIVVTLPLAFVGAFWALWLGGFVLDPVAFVGIIVLVGIVVNNGIVLVDHVNALRREGMDRTAALLEGCGDRFRPVLMTASTTIFGLLPLALSNYTVAGAYMDSLAVTVAGGLLSSTLFTLLGLPVWYTTVEDMGSLLLRVLPRRARGRRGFAPPTDSKVTPSAPSGSAWRGSEACRT